jgi:dTDP-4-amino-4,6-dideoxygalactose transaminase
VNSWQGGLAVSPDAGLVERIRRRVAEWRSLTAAGLAGIGLSGGVTDLATWPPLFSSLTHPVVRRAVLRGIPAVVRRLDPESGARRLDALPPAYLRRMAPVQAELALRQLDGVDADSGARIARARRYREGLDGLLHPPPPDGLSQTYSYYPVQGREREALRRRRDFAAQSLRNCADLPEFAEFRRDCPNAWAAARELVLLPAYPRYPLAEVDRNIAVIRDFYSQ